MKKSNKRFKLKKLIFFFPIFKMELANTIYLEAGNKTSVATSKNMSDNHKMRDTKTLTANHRMLHLLL